MTPKPHCITYHLNLTISHVSENETKISLHRVSCEDHNHQASVSRGNKIYNKNADKQWL